MTTAAPAPEDVLKKVDALGPPGTPVTTPEVAEEFDCTQRTIYNRLESLVDDGTLLTKKVGANSRVWWHPVDGKPLRNGDTSDRQDSVSSRDGKSPSLTADSEMAARINEFEWADTPLGSMDEWPPELRVAVDIMLGADEAIGIYWGEDLTLLYNDLARDVIGKKHPDALGQPARNVFPEAWDTLGPIHEQVMAGDGATRFEEFLLPLERTDEIEDVWWDSSYSPIPLADGSIGGVFNIAVDVTDQKRREQNTAFLEDLEAELTQLTTPEEIVTAAGERINEYLDVAVYNMSSIDEEADTVDHLYRWEDDIVRPLPDTVSLSEFSTEEFQETARAGEPIVSADTHEDRYTDPQAAETIDVRSFITVPFHRDGEWEYLLSLTDPDPRDWREDEVELVQELANRLFPRLERARAEQALRESEQRNQRLFDSINESIEEIFFIVERLADESKATSDRENLVDYRFVETNPVFEELIGVTDVVGKLVSDLDLDGDLPGSDLWDEVVRTGDSRRFEIETTDGPLADGWYDVRVFPYGSTDSGAVACLVDDITERKQMEAHLRESERRYRTILNSMDEGFFLADVVFDSDGEAFDIFYRDSNPAAVEMVGEEFEGRWLTEIDMGYEEYWYEVFGRVASTGEGERHELYAEPDGIWYNFYVFKPEGAGPRRVAVVFQDITGRKEAEEELQQEAELDAFRIELTDTIRPLSDPEEIQREAARVLGEWLDVDRAHYGEVLEDENSNIVHADYYRGDVSSIAGSHQLDDYGSYIGEAFRAGDTVAIEDLSTLDELSDEERALSEAVEIAAWIGVPLVKDDRLEAYFVVNDATPREWTETEVEMVEETAERTWAAVARAYAEQNLRESEARYQMLFESIIEGFCIIEVLFDEDDEPVDYRFLQTNPAFEEQTGLDDAEGKRMKELEPNHENRWFEIYGRIAKTGEPERFTNPAEHLDDRWYDVNAFRVGDPEERKVAVAFTDVSDSKHFQLALERLNEASQNLIDSDPEEIKDQTVDIVQSVLNVEYAALWCYDETTGELDEYTSQTSSEFSPDTVRLPGEFSEEIWQTFMGDDVDIDNDIDAIESESAVVSLRSRVLVPLGRHGVICAGSTQAGAFDEQNIGLVETVGGTVEAAWDRAAGEEILASRNEELTRLDRLNMLIREIDQGLVAAGTREEIDEVVCEQLADSDLYEFAWIGYHDPGTDVVEPRAWARVDSGYLEDLTITVEDTPTNRDPIARAVRTGDLQVVADIATDSDFAPWREATLGRGARSLVCIPLVYDDVTYGVLTVYADHPQSNEDERNQQVLSELGDTIAHTINARETRATLQTDSVVELTLRFGDADTPLCRLARETECTIDYQGFVPRSNGQADVFFIARGISPADLQATASHLLAFDDLDCLTEGADGALFRARVSDPTLAARVTDDGAVVRSITIDASVATAALDVPHTAAVREFLDRLRQWNPNFELRARQSCERPLKTRQTFVTSLEDQLTDRQREVLQTAYLSGYFEMPRVSNGQEVTELLGVSQPTFTEHLRVAERTLCEILFETESYADDIGSM